MAELKTKPNDGSVEDYLNKISDENAREDCKRISAMMKKATGAEPKMWGEAIIGFGERTLKYSTGRELDWLEIGFAPRKANLTLYLNIGEGWDEELLSKLGRHKLGKGCLYFKKLSDVDEKVLDKLIVNSVKSIRKK